MPPAFIILTVDAELVKRLLELNRKFYSRFSAEFSASRASERLNIEPFQKYLANEIHLLDAGCGNGRLAETLERAGYALDYVGVDASPELIALAEKQRGALKRIRANFRVLDLTAPRWSESLRDAAPFDVIIALAVLHHIPSFELRGQVLREIHALLKPNGIFIMSNWQFLNNERLRKKIVPWEKLEIGNWKLEVGDGRPETDSRQLITDNWSLITDDWGLETGDYLLDWKRGGVGYRYVHLLDQAEVQRLAHASGFQVVEQFLADADLNLFGILTRGA